MKGTSSSDNDDHNYDDNHDDGRGFSNAYDTGRGDGFLSRLKMVIFRRQEDGGYAMSTMTPGSNFAAPFATAEMLTGGDETGRNNNEEDSAEINRRRVHIPQPRIQGDVLRATE